LYSALTSRRGRCSDAIEAAHNALSVTIRPRQNTTAYFAQPFVRQVRGKTQFSLTGFDVKRSLPIATVDVAVGGTRHSRISQVGAARIAFNLPRKRNLILRQPRLAQAFRIAVVKAAQIGGVEGLARLELGDRPGEVLRQREIATQRIARLRIVARERQ
jgi:hypothetical protein